MPVAERLPEPSNPLGVDGIEFIEFSTAEPQAFGALLQQMGFAAVARHRSREVMLYRQGGMNLIVNSHPGIARGHAEPEKIPDRANLGICMDSYHVLANRSGLEALREIDPQKLFLVQLSDFMWREVRSAEDRIETARHSRVFPGEGVHSEQVIELVRALDAMGYRGEYSFEVFNDDYRQLPLSMVAARARRSITWITGLVSRRSLPARRTAGTRHEA